MDDKIAEHLDVVEAHHKFGGVVCRGTTWDLSHLAAFAIRRDPGLGFHLDVVVLFSCHCFTHSFVSDGRVPKEIPAEEIFNDGREVRVLSEERYALSRRYLTEIVRGLAGRQIQFAGVGTNFITVELTDESFSNRLYCVFFEVEKDRRRKKRVLLRIQSAYLLDALTSRQKKAGKVRFDVLLRATYEGRRLKG